MMKWIVFPFLNCLQIHLEEHWFYCGKGFSQNLWSSQHHLLLWNHDVLLLNPAKRLNYFFDRAFIIFASPMIRYLSIALVSIYVIAFTELHQLLKLPVLVEHFIEHKQLVQSLTLFEFLAVHYTTDAQHDDHDMQLPFKDFEHCIAAQPLVIPYFKIELTHTLTLACPVSYSFFHKNIYLPSYQVSIWQPPKV